jgi:hypothetical protein
VSSRWRGAACAQLEARALQEQKLLEEAGADIDELRDEVDFEEEEMEAQQNLLPTVADPKLFMIPCKVSCRDWPAAAVAPERSRGWLCAQVGKEHDVVLRLMRKFVSHQARFSVLRACPLSSLTAGVRGAGLGVRCSVLHSLRVQHARHEGLHLRGGREGGARAEGHRGNLGPAALQDPPGAHPRDGADHHGAPGRHGGAQGPACPREGRQRLQGRHRHGEPRTAHRTGLAEVASQITDLREHNTKLEIKMLPRIDVAAIKEEADQLRAFEENEGPNLSEARAPLPPLPVAMSLTPIGCRPSA